MPEIFIGICIGTFCLIISNNQYNKNSLITYLIKLSFIGFLGTQWEVIIWAGTITCVGGGNDVISLKQFTS